MGWVGRRVVDTIDGLPEVVLALGRDRATGIGVAVEAREVAAGDLQANAVAGAKDVRGGAGGLPLHRFISW